MKRKVMITMFAVVAAVGVLFACFVLYMRFVWLGDHSTEIQEGFSQELVEDLYAKYQISIPENAVFVKGIHTNALREPKTFILFKCPIAGEDLTTRENVNAYIFRTLGLDDDHWTQVGVAETIVMDHLEEMGGPLDWQIDYHDGYSAFIQFSVRDSEVVMRFWDNRPGNGYP